MIKLTQLINELGINKPSEFYKFKKGGEYVVTYDLGDEEIYSFPLKIASIDSGGCCIALHIGHEDIDYNDQQDIDNYGFTLCKEDVIKVEPYVVNELQINNPNVTKEEVEKFWDSNIFLNQDYRDLKKKYCLKYSINSSSDTEILIQILPQHALNNFYRDLKELYKQQQYKEDPNDLAESLNKFVEIDEISDILLSEFPEHQNKIQEYIDTIEIEPSNYENLTYHHLLDDFKNFVENDLNELQVNNPNITAEGLHDYLIDGRLLYNHMFATKYMEICEPYSEKYKIIGGIVFLHEFEKLSQQELNKLFSKTKQLVYKHVNNLNELGINKPEPNSHLFRVLNAWKMEVWRKILKKQYDELVEENYNNFNPETDINFELGDFSGEKEANVVYLNFSEFEAGWEASIDEKYFNIKDDEGIVVKRANIKGLNFYYITYNI